MAALVVLLLVKGQLAYRGSHLIWLLLQLMVWLALVYLGRVWLHIQLLLILLLRDLSLPVVRLEVSFMNFVSSDSYGH